MSSKLPVIEFEDEDDMNAGEEDWRGGLDDTRGGGRRPN